MFQKRGNIYKEKGFTFIDLDNEEKVIIHSNGSLLCMIDTTTKTKTIKIAGDNKIICTIECTKNIIKVTPISKKMILNVSTFTPRAISQILLDFLQKMKKNENDIIPKNIIKKIILVANSLLKKSEMQNLRNDTIKTEKVANMNERKKNFFIKAMDSMQKI